ncbi:zinc finger RNA-binding protein [Trichomycterus rosablanca]|uniref:zinc finger RNA-binding protein n=1 Tax=Trichomycterus rosablanca TaxID=2290929 RepID=UPI002F35A4B4
MAASNYYGYTHGAVAPQYSIQQPPAYSQPTTASYCIQPAPAVAQTASYAPAPAPAAATAHNPQPPVSQTYQPYQTQMALDYRYGQQQETPAQPTTTPQNYQENYSYGRAMSVGSYDNKQYYQTSIAPAQHTSTGPYFQQDVKSEYMPVNAVYSQTPRQDTPVKAPLPASSMSTSYNTYPISTSVQQPSNPSTYTPSSSYNSTPATSYSGHSYSTYEPSSYTSTQAYYQPAQHLCPQQSQNHLHAPSHHTPSTSHQPQNPSRQFQGPSHQPHPSQQPAQVPAKQFTSSSWSNSKSNPVTSAAGGTYKTPTFYQPKAPKPKGPPKQPQLHYCDICRISCAGPQTYREHLEGQKHKKKEAAQKSGAQTANGPHNAQTQLCCELCDISCTGSDAYKAHIRGAKHLKVVKLHTKLGKPIPSTEPVLVNSAPVSTTTPLAKTQASAGAPAAPQKPAVSNPVKAQAPVKQPAAQKTTVVAASPEPVKNEQVMKSDPQSDGEGDGCGSQSDIQPVGNDYVEEIRNEDGKLVRFHCKLCECSFNDPNAKDMHLKGRRHRLQYKKKVNPELVVEIKPNNRARKLLDSRLTKQKVQTRHHEDEQHWHIEMRRYEEDLYWRRAEEEQMYWDERRRMAPPSPAGHPGMAVPPLLPAVRRPDSPDDRHIMAKHAAIYPADGELEAVQRIVSHVEKALKKVSDVLQTQEGKDSANNKVDQGRMLKGVMRVGILAKGLLLRGDRNIQLILLTDQKPTVSLLNDIVQLLPKQLNSSEDQYLVRAQPEEASIVILSSTDPKMQVTVCLTSPVMREEPGTEEKAGNRPPEKVPEEDLGDVLKRKKCLEYLAALRHAKWFQARANGLQSCVIVIRVLRDLGQRIPTWSEMSDWVMELLVEKAISSAATALSPGEAMRRVLECVASGVILEDGPGLLDPCEKGQTDALEGMTKQAREDITESAQYALRLLAFRQIHKLLGLDSPPASKIGARSRKRRRDGADEGEGEGKKDKKHF